MALRLLVLLIGFMLFTVQARGEEKILLPVFAQVAGGYDSRFTSSVTLFNSSADSITIRGLREACPITCPGPHDRTELFPGPRIASDFYNDGNPGFFLIVSNAVGLHLNLRVKDLTRQTLSAGTEIPAIHESDFRAATITLLITETSARFRNNLRVYGLQPGLVQIRVVTEDGTVVDDRFLSLSTPRSEFDPPFAQLLNFPASSTARLRIDVIPALGVKIWAFVSTTNNVSQEITTVTPQSK